MEALRPQGIDTRAVNSASLPAAVVLRRKQSCLVQWKESCLRMPKDANRAVLAANTILLVAAARQALKPALGIHHISYCCAEQID